MKNYTLQQLIFVFIWVFLQACTPKETITPQPLELGSLFSNSMVLQQKENVPIWGTYTPKQEITVRTTWGEEVQTEVGTDGKWRADLQTPSAGGPYELSINTIDTSLIIKDILIGEVWITSGQSNAEMPLTGFLPWEPVDNYEEEIQNANYPNIRMFTVIKDLKVTKQENLIGKWEVCSPETAGHFSAMGYFFARKLHQELSIPIGIIHSSWGGTVAEAWVSKERLAAFPEFIEQLERFEDTSEADAWASQFKQKIPPLNPEEFNPEEFGAIVLADPKLDDSNWKTLNLPHKECHTDSFIVAAKIQQRLNGVFWYRKTIEINDISQPYTLRMGAIDDADVVYINGQEIGRTWSWNSNRKYQVPDSLLVKGINSIAILHFDGGGGSNVNGPMVLENAIGTKLSLEGPWKGLFYADTYDKHLLIYGLEAQSQLNKRPYIISGGPNELPSSLFNAMIHPMIPYKIKGVTWYQGESNVLRAQQYVRLFPILIEDWRTFWGYDFPFYYVQIAPFDTNTGESANLRDAQRLSLNTPNTGMVVTMDIGHPTSIHPGNKQDVGLRLALLALANDYDKDLVASGPLYKSHTTDGNKIVLEFDHVGSGLMAGPEGLNGFEIASKGERFVPAIAQIVGDHIELTAPNIVAPVHVRYGWKDYFNGSLFNKEGLPASSFTSGY